MITKNHSFLKVQKGVLSALLIKEIIARYGRDNVGFLWLILEPMLFTLGITALWTAIKATHGSNLPITAFAVTGYSSVLLWRNITSRSSSAIKANHGSLYHAPVRIIHILIARIALEIISATASFLILVLCFINIGWMKWPIDTMEIILGWALLAWFGASLGLIIGSLSEFSHISEKIWHTISYLLFPVSGAAFMVDWLPKGGQEFVLYLPMVNGLELVREGFFGSQVHAHYFIFYTICSCLILTFIGLILTNIANDHAGSA